MADLNLLDGAFHFIMTRMVATGVAPHYSELAKELGCSIGQGRQTLHDLMEVGLTAWLHPNTDWIASFAPFSSIPTQYRITVDGEQKWYAQ